jgi:hypothetical protein
MCLNEEVLFQTDRQQSLNHEKTVVIRKIMDGITSKYYWKEWQKPGRKIIVK